MLREYQGICPRCRINTGSVGQACPNPDCLTHQYNYIPILAYDAAIAQAEKRGGRIDPWLGRRFDRYLLCGKAGEGGMGTVYIALQAPLNREVALKVMTSISVSREALARFESEAKALSTLDHPNVLKLFDFGFGNMDGQTVPYMVLEFIKHGRTLKKVFQQDIEAFGAMRDDTRLPVFEQILAGLAAAHSVGITHRDVKPENVMLTQIHGNPNFVKVLDFGLASGMRGDEADKTGANQLLGTPNYMAPEQIPGARRMPLDHRADLYAVGVMAFEALTGSRPFPGETTLAVLTAKASETFNPFDTPAVQRLTRTQRAFLEKAIAFDPDDRFDSAGDMTAALREAMAEAGSGSGIGLFKLFGGLMSRPRNQGSGDAGYSTPTPTPTTSPILTPPPRPAAFSVTPPGGMQAGGSRPVTGQSRRVTGPIAQLGTPGLEVDMGTRPITGQYRTMTPEERAERLKNRRRRTTGRNMSAARLSEAGDAMESSRGRGEGRKLSVIGLVLVALLLGITALVLVPRIQESKRFDRVGEDLKILSVPLSNNGRFVGVDSKFLLPGNQSDHYVSDALRDGQPALDPWGNPYRVKYSLQNPKAYVLFSTGPDGEKDDCASGPNSDDICVSLGPP
ncbi:MAG TPA: protein kinase [Myxococcota bacterium]|nr:protein kinase [Myxococcota bacterium]